MIVETPEARPTRVDGVVEAHEGLVDHVLHAQDPLAGESMCCGHQRDAPFVAQRTHPHGAVFGGTMASGDVNVGEPGSRVARGEGQLAVAHDDIRIGESEGVHLETAREAGRGAEEAEVDRSTMAACERPGGAVRLDARGDRQAGLGVEGLPGGGQRDAARVPIEQFQAEVGLELGDRLRERGLSDPEPPSGARHLSLLRHGDEVLELSPPEGHRCSRLGEAANCSRLGEAANHTAIQASR